MIFNLPENHRIVALLFAVICSTALADDPAMPAATEPNARTEIMGQRFLTLNTVVRVRQIEVTRDTAHGPDESSVHTPAEARTFRETIGLVVATPVIY